MAKAIDVSKTKAQDIINAAKSTAENIVSTAKKTGEIDIAFDVDPEDDE